MLVGLAIFLRVPSRSTAFRSLPLKTKLDNMDPLGSMLIMGAACCLLLALQWGGDAKPWNSPDVIGCLVGAVTIGVIFLLWQWKRQERALIIPRVFKQRSVWTGSVALFCLGAQAYAVGQIDSVSLATLFIVNGLTESRFPSSYPSGSKPSRESLQLLLE